MAPVPEVGPALPSQLLRELRRTTPRLLTVWCNHHPLRGTLAVNSKQNLSLRLGGQAVEVRHRVHWLAFDALDHVARLQTHLGRRTIGI